MIWLILALVIGGPLLWLHGYLIGHNRADRTVRAIYHLWPKRDFTQLYDEHGVSITGRYSDC